jgi:hypothetical protein
MGSGTSTLNSIATTTAVSTTPMTTTPTPMEEYELKKHRAGCTGMFWRADPTKTTPLASNNDWPRDGASFRGHVVVVKGEKWLLAKQVKQKAGEWKDAPEGAAMPFEYNNHYSLE